MAAIGCQRLLLFTENRRYCRFRNNESRGLMLTRRKFLATTACTVAAAHLHVQAQGKVKVALSIPREAKGPHMPRDFVGLSYQVQQLTDASCFSSHDSGLIRA